MARLNKADREAVRTLFGGRCAYCGAELAERWHVDHVEPSLRKLEIVQTAQGVQWRAGATTRPDRDVLTNYMPACPPCNIDKHAMSLENWRGKLQRTIQVLMNNSPTFRHAVRFGMLHVLEAPVVFYFERCAAPRAPSKDEASVQA
ncbi:HNH endonuclease signature motif containing protein [Caballeronia sp. LZ033]|uniref:HNH endonuclease n=1 Tax=Caballeronia sp. LZ033 TaxID=3038566 RepID=UPI00286BE586|nr:HNH endonuclease signature motif containing protein [Caballeronia sp. LZ033]